MFKKKAKTTYTSHTDPQTDYERLMEQADAQYRQYINAGTKLSQTPYLSNSTSNTTNPNNLYTYYQPASPNSYWGSGSSYYGNWTQPGIAYPSLAEIVAEIIQRHPTRVNEAINPKTPDSSASMFLINEVTKITFEYSTSDIAIELGKQLHQLMEAERINGLQGF